MLNPPLLDGLQARMVKTPRLHTHIITGGPEDGEPVVLVHGNASAARFYEELMVAMPSHFRAIAPDMRGYGRSEAAPLDATRGLRDFSDDLHALIQTLGLQHPHLVGWSLGGAVVMQYAIDHPQDIASITLIVPAPPYGVGCTRDTAGTLTSPDFVGSGGGMVNREFVQRLKSGDRSADSPASPRNTMNALYFKPPFRSPREEVFLDEILTTVCGEDNYPGDWVTVPTWPGVAPGMRGYLNAISPKYCNLAGFARINPRPPVLWVRGDSDRVVSDTSLIEAGFLGQIGYLPDWPGPEVSPPQPMIGQTRAVLDAYAANGGYYQEVLLPDCGHSPHIEQSEAFQELFFAFVSNAVE